MHTLLAFKQLTYAQPVLMLMSKIPTLNLKEDQSVSEITELHLLNLSI